METPSNYPSWMDLEFFTTVVKHHSSDSAAKAVDFIVKPSYNPSENYVSTMFRTEIKFSTSSSEEHSLSVVIKIPPSGGVQSDFANSSSIYQNELDMYNGPLREIKALLESVGDSSQINPKLIYQSTKPRFVIIMEDLGVAGYERITQPLENFEDSKIVFQRLAKFHAASYFLINERKADFSRFNFCMFAIDDPTVREKFLLEPIDAFVEVLEEWGGYEEYVEKLKIFKASFEQKGQELYKPNPNGFNVLNHGDFHVKNLLFKKNEGKIEDFFMLDFQISVIASPCIDLFYALYNDISDENRTNRRNEIIQFYHFEFTSTLKKFGFIGKIPSLLDLNLELMRNGWMEVVKCIVFKQYFWEDATTLLASSDSKAHKKRVFNDKKFKKFIKAELPRLTQLGFL
jgi:thiamine kinase-like enzyme